MKKTLLSTLLVAVLLIATALCVFAERVTLVEVLPEEGIRSKLVTNYSDTRNLEIAIFLDGEDGYYSIYSTVDSYYPTPEDVLEVSFATDFEAKASEYSELVLEYTCCIWPPNDPVPATGGGMVYVSTDGGATWTENGVTLTVEETESLVIVGSGGGPLYKAVSDNLLTLVPADATITNIKLVPITANDLYVKGAFRIVSMKVEGEKGTNTSAASSLVTAAATTAAPETTKAPETTAAPAAPAAPAAASALKAKYVVLGFAEEAFAADKANLGGYTRLSEFNLTAAEDVKVGDANVAKGENLTLALDKAGLIQYQDNLGAHGSIEKYPWLHTYSNLVNGEVAIGFNDTFMKKGTLEGDAIFADAGIAGYVMYTFDKAYLVDSYTMSFQTATLYHDMWKILVSEDGKNWTLAADVTGNANALVEKEALTAGQTYAISLDGSAAPAETTAAPATTTAAPAATTTAAPAATTKAPAATTVTAAQTSDLALVMALGLLVVAGLAYTASKKSR